MDVRSNLVGGGFARYRSAVPTLVGHRLQSRMLPWCLRGLLVGAFALASASGYAAPPSKVALVGAKIIPVVGDPIESGTLLIEDGKITAIGEKVEIPYDAMEVDVSGKVLFPGMIDAHSARGLDVPNENLPVTPFLDVYDAMDPSKLYFENALRDGITSIHVIVANNCVIGGLSRVVHPIGLTMAEMTLHAPVALKMSVSPKRGSDRMVQMATLRETFSELADYLEKRAEEKYEESLEKKDEKIEVSPKEAVELGKPMLSDADYDDKHRNLVRLTRGDLDVFIYCQLASDVGRALKMAGDNGFVDRSSLVLGSNAYKAVKEIKSAGRPVVLESSLIYRQRDPITGEIEETFVPKVFADAGVAFSLLPSPDTSLAERYLNYQAARCVRHGVSRDSALEAITINPAKALGVGDRVGSLEVGKVANVVVFSGDPLDFNTWVDTVYINGIRAYERSTDIRLEQLFGNPPDEVSKEESSDEQVAEEKPAEDAESGKIDDGEEAPADESKDSESESDEPEGASGGNG